MAPKSTDLAIIFAEITGSTRLYEVLGDASARAKVAGCLDMLSDVVIGAGGIVIKTIGDEIMCTFPTAEAATIAACDMQESMEEEVTEQTKAGPISLTLRIGIHFGPAILEAGDVFGDAVNVAARMHSIAKSGQIITTQSTRDLLPPILEASTRHIDSAHVKGKKDTLDIWEVLWQHEDITRMSTGVVEQPSGNAATLKLAYRGETTQIGGDRTQIVLGRSKTADLTINESLASRQHVKIEYRRGKFFIVDQSTNGTYVNHNDEIAFLRREEMPLGEAGQISLGRSFSDDPKEIVEFVCE